MFLTLDVVDGRHLLFEKESQECGDMNRGTKVEEIELSLKRIEESLSKLRHGRG